MPPPGRGDRPRARPPAPVALFHIPHGEWIRLLRSNGFEIEELLELRPPEGTTKTYTGVPPTGVPLEWARRWPSEEVWKVRKR